MEAKSGGLFLEAVEKVVPVFFFVIALAGVAVSLSVFKHPVNDPSQFVGDRFDRLRHIEPGTYAAAEGAKIRNPPGEALAGCWACCSSVTERAAMLLHRASPVTRQSFAHPLSIYELGSRSAAADWKASSDNLTMPAPNRAYDGRETPDMVQAAFFLGAFFLPLRTVDGSFLPGA
jgi:hypothetical protein